MTATPQRLRRPERRNLVERRAVIERVAGEFNEMRCLRLTAAQAQRLFDLRADVCDRVLAGLVADGMLLRGSDGRYALADHPAHSPFALVGSAAVPHPAGVRGPSRGRRPPVGE